MGNVRELLENFPREQTIGEILDQLKDEQENAESDNIRCAHQNCGRLIFRAPRGIWRHVAPSGSVSRSCKSAAFDDPEPGDTDQSEWLNWPRALERQQARPPRR